MAGAERARRPCAGAVVHDREGRLLLVLRRNPPAAGTWSVPGGRCQASESAAAACVREVVEETGLIVEVQHLAGRVERDAPDGSLYVIDDFVCQVIGGHLRAGDDALEARWVGPAEFERVPLAPGLVDALARWRLLPGQARGEGSGRPGCSPPRASM